ncbi:FliH/SctL family protein [Ramlibacter humi]|uniref:FliH/SctL family protein n=1 Tax=Ramlibacter humi TaxID=2530451 RepID=UPI00142FEC7F|nr:FliH/SctL family protein [Ramlibacter humi]
MSGTGIEAGLVLRDASLQPESVRIGRRAVFPAAPTAGAAPAVHAIDPEKLHEAVLARAREEAVRLGREEGLRAGREEGLRAGYDEGLKKGQADAQAAAAAALDKAVAEAMEPLRERESRLQALAAAVDQQQAAWRELAEDEAVALAYELACRVLGSALVTPEGIRAQVRQLRDQARAGAAFHVHPDDLPLLRSEPGAQEATRWVADVSVATGGCIARSASAALDARLETLLEECLQGLLEVRARRAQGGGE